MAVRTGAGTGVIVSLVVFVITTVALLILTIAFYSGRAEAVEARAAAQDELAKYVRPQQRNQDLFQSLEAAANRENQSVAGYLNSQLENTMRFLNGNPTATLEQVRTGLGRFGVGENDVVANVVQDYSRQLQQQQDEIDGLNNQLAELNSRNEQLLAQMDQLRESHREELNAVQDQIAGYRQAADEYRAELNETKRTMNETVDRLNDRYLAEVDTLQNENDELHRESVRLRDRINELQARISADRLQAQDPSQLVDARVLDVTGGGEQVFIDRGRQHRVVLGMTFEVYDDAASIRVDERTNELPRGKASVQVVRVGETSSTCKVVRSVPGRPVVREDVVANAVYDPDYQFKFMVHGIFDMDGDGRATRTEAEYIERLIQDWGGAVVTGDELPGDLDFLVLGVPPSNIPPLPDDATEFQINDYLRKREAKDLYERLFRQAREGQIPVLNHNRFLILIGHTQR